MKLFTTLNLRSIIATLGIVIIEKSELTFLLILYFHGSTKNNDSLTLKRHNSFQNKNNRKAACSFALRPMYFKLQQEV